MPENIGIDEMTLSDSNKYTSPAKIFHWLTALFIVLQCAVGWIMPDVDELSTPEGLVSVHLSIGVLIAVLVVVRLMWRFGHKPPQASIQLSPAFRFAAGVTHWSIYLLLLIVPILGWINAVERGWSVTLFGIYRVPDMLPRESTLWADIGDMHIASVWVLVALVCLHALAAFYHHVVLKDDTLKRMLPGS